MGQGIRTDLALERLEAANVDKHSGKVPEGVQYSLQLVRGIDVHTMSVNTEEAAELLCKPVGVYHTVSLEKLRKRQDDAFLDTAKCIAQLLRGLLPKGTSFLICCLGNRSITPDALGPVAAESIMVTRHLKSYMPEAFHGFASTSLISPGVLGTTGIESALIVKGAVEAAKPDCVIVIDALAARCTDRLCCTVQICNTGIEPGSGVGNRRYALNRETLGIPVISMGIPTVVDAATFVSDLTDGGELKQGREEPMLITPKEIDVHITDGAKLLAYSINFALHEELTLADIDLFIS